MNYCIASHFLDGYTTALAFSGISLENVDALLGHTSKANFGKKNATRRQHCN